jgi:hypothetical protein
MANNRMWILHRPSGRRVQLGRRMGFGWYGPEDMPAMNEFFQACEKESDAENQDDFVLELEDPPNGLR